MGIISVKYFICQPQVNATKSLFKVYKFYHNKAGWHQLVRVCISTKRFTSKTTKTKWLSLLS